MTTTQPAFRLATILACSLVYLFDGLIHTILGPLAPAIASNNVIGVSCSRLVAQHVFDKLYEFGKKCRIGFFE